MYISIPASLRHNYASPALVCSALLSCTKIHKCQNRAPDRCGLIAVQETHEPPSWPPITIYILHFLFGNMRARALLLSIGLSILIPGSLGWWSTSTTTRRTSSVTSSGTSSLPSPTPTIDCSYGVIADALSDPSTRWYDANEHSFNSKLC